MAEKKKKTFKESQPEGPLKGSVFDYVPDAEQMSNYLNIDSEKIYKYLKEFINNDGVVSSSQIKADKKPIKKAKGGAVRAYNNGGAVMAGRGPKYKGMR